VWRPPGSGSVTARHSLIGYRGWRPPVVECRYKNHPARSCPNPSPSSPSMGKCRRRRCVSRRSDATPHPCPSLPVGCRRPHRVQPELAKAAVHFASVSHHGRHCHAVLHRRVFLRNGPHFTSPPSLPHRVSRVAESSSEKSSRRSRHRRVSTHRRGCPSPTCTDRRLTTVFASCAGCRSHLQTKL
jgi:hypothetical protein